MSGEAEEAGPQRSGRTTIRSQAIRHIAEAVAADAAGVPAGRVSAALGDERGGLVVRVATPFELGTSMTSPRSLVDRAGELASAVTTRLDELAGRSVRRVDVRVTGAYRSDQRRVQ